MDPIINEALKKVPSSLVPLEARVFGVEGPRDTYRGVMFLVARGNRFDGFSVTRATAGPERAGGGDRDAVKFALDQAREWYQSEWISLEK